MATQMFTWRVGAIPLDVHRGENGYWWLVPGNTERYTATMVAKGNWTLMVGERRPVQVGMKSLRTCIAHSFGVSIDVVKNVM